MRDWSNRKYHTFGVVRTKVGYRVCTVKRLEGNYVTVLSYSDHIPVEHLAVALDYLESIQRGHTHRLI